MTRRQFVALSAAGAGALTWSAAGEAAQLPDRRAMSGRASPTAAKISWRIRQPHWVPDDGFAQLTALLAKHRQVVDEVCLFESLGMSYFPAAQVWERIAADVCRERPQYGFTTYRPGPPSAC